MNHCTLFVSSATQQISNDKVTVYNYVFNFQSKIIGICKLQECRDQDVFLASFHGEHSSLPGRRWGHRRDPHHPYSLTLKMSSSLTITTKQNLRNNRTAVLNDLQILSHTMLVNEQLFLFGRDLEERRTPIPGMHN